jgi:hypothetical protein
MSLCLNTSLFKNNTRYDIPFNQKNSLLPTHLKNIISFCKKRASDSVKYSPQKRNTTKQNNTPVHHNITNTFQTELPARINRHFKKQKHIRISSHQPPNQKVVIIDPINFQILHNRHASRFDVHKRKALNKASNSLIIDLRCPVESGPVSLDYSECNDYKSTVGWFNNEMIKEKISNAHPIYLSDISYRSKLSRLFGRRTKTSRNILLSKPNTASTHFRNDIIGPIYDKIREKNKVVLSIPIVNRIEGI